ncbi:hypothetical protein R5R35_009130 [Gryllus longicercus]|uniref:G-protein coupled receptors family 1 profile domain-containing protein n=1 Tax=Gryllus longicercus TaxID=2509291 RepID=A0AAN9VSL8_9ORTH
MAGLAGARNVTVGAGGGVSLLDGLDASASAAAAAAAGAAPVAPEWLVALYLSVVVGGGVAANAALAASIVRRRRRRWRWQGPGPGPGGDPHLLGLLLCLACADAGSLLLVAPFEVLVLGGAPDGLWIFAGAYCRVFLGLEVLLGSVAAYSILAVNLHAVLGPPSQPDADGGTGKERAGAWAGSGAGAAAALVWLLAASLSVPAFVAADVVEARPAQPLCTARALGFAAHVLLAAFRVAVPACALLACAGAAALRLCGGGGGAGTAAGARRCPLRVALLLALSFAALSLHRAVFAALHPLLPWASGARGPPAFASPPLAAAPATPAAALAFAMLHHALPSLRPLLACLGGRGLRDQLRRGDDAHGGDDDDDAGCCCPCAGGGGGRARQRAREESEALR